MSNALSLTYSGQELGSRLDSDSSFGPCSAISSGLAHELNDECRQAKPYALGDDASPSPALTPSAFLQEAMRSTRNLLALSTVARLIMDRERRKDDVHSAASGRALQREEDGHFFCSQRTAKDADGNPSHLDYRIQELEVSLKRIAASGLPATTKDIVRKRILEQIALLRSRSYAHPPASAE